MADKKKDTGITNKVITVGKRKLTVWKKTFEMNLTRFTLMEAAEKSMNGNAEASEGEGIADLIRRGFTLRTFPSLQACTTGKVFTLDEAMAEIESDDLELWLSAARELNPDWFPSAEPETIRETIEKKEN